MLLDDQKAKDEEDDLASDLSTCQLNGNSEHFTKTKINGNQTDVQFY
jgi:hypothetical protein